MTSVAQATQTVTTEYNGWSNRETWIMNLWITNDISFYDAISYIIETYDVNEQPAELEAWVRGEFDRLDMNASLWSDLLYTALGRVSWYEIVVNNREGAL